MKKTFFLIILQLLVSSAFAVTVMGNRSCGNWIEGRQTGGISDVAASAWLVGYLSGLAVESNKDILASADGPSLFLWMDKYCRENALDRLEKAGYILSIELAGKIRK